MLREWYNIGNIFFDCPAETSQDALLWETDSEKEGEVLLQSLSSEAELQASSLDSNKEDILIATDSEDAADECNPTDPQAKKRRYSSRESSKIYKLTFLSLPVCRHAHMRLYAIGSNALQQLRSGERVILCMRAGSRSQNIKPLMFPWSGTKPE